MDVTLETARPLDQSSLWRLHDAYFAAKGVAAWHDGEVPSYSTSNYQAAVQHVDFFIQTLADGGEAPDGILWVLEVGSGHGAFAVNFLRALDAHRDAATWAPRVRYLLTDYHASGLDAAAALPDVEPFVKAGRIVPALFDLRAPGAFTRRDGAPPPPAVHLVVANYVTCVLPLKNLQRRGAQWFEQHVAIRGGASADEGASTDLLDAMIADAGRANLIADELTLDFSWEPVSLAALYANPIHAAILERLAAPFEEATVGYPHGFVDFMVAFADRVAPGGYFLLNDYGAVGASDLEGLTDRRPEFYGNSLANSINFAIFDSLAGELGWACLRTRAAEEILHSAALRPHRDWSPGALGAFDDAYVARRGCDDVLDFWTAAIKLEEGKDLDGALRFWSRLIRLEPYHIEHYYRAGVVAIDAGRVELARALLEKGQTLAGRDARFDFAFQLGRAYCLLGLNDLAVAAYQESLATDPHAVTFTNLGIILEDDGHYHRAFRAYRAAAAADPEDPRPLERLALLRDRLWRHTLEAWEGPDVEDPLAVTAIATEPDPDEGPADDGGVDA